MRELRLIIAMACIVLAHTVHAGIEDYRFDDSEAQARFYRLASEYTCIGCQDGSLVDTLSLQAVDLRTQIYRMVTSGKSDKEIRDFLVYRYGEHILYRSPGGYNWLVIWGLPVLMMMIAGCFITWFYRCVRV